MRKMLMVSIFIPAYCVSNEIINIADMRKALSMDIDKRSVIPLSRPVDCDDL